MIKTIFALSALAAVSLSLVIPQQQNKVVVSNSNDECGAVTLAAVAFFNAKWQKVAATGNAASGDHKCPICQDLVILADNYLDCAEGMLQSKLDDRCESTFTGFLQDVCYDLVNGIIDDLQKDTDKEVDPDKICGNLVGPDCKMPTTH